jgi:hypothetical protein
MIGGHVDADYYRDRGWNLPRSYRLFRTANAALRVCFWNTGRGVLGITARSRRTAYDVLNALWGLATIAFGFEPIDGVQQLLYSLERLPDAAWSDEKLADELTIHNPESGEAAIRDLTLGPVLEHHRLIFVRDHIGPLLANRPLHEALQHFRASRQLFHGHMVGSYYQLHYARDRRRMHWRELERLYYEHKATFELAFVSAFKALERLLGANHFRAGDIRRLLSDATFLRVSSATRYRRYHEIFRGLKRDISVEDMLRHLLKLRNASAAHANSTPPRELMLSEDNIYEIQNFVVFLVGQALSTSEAGAVGTRYEPDIIAQTDRHPAVPAT